jgi:hypothetical protein
MTLQRWTKAGKVKAPEPTLIGAVGYSLGEREEAKVVKLSMYHKGGDRKKKRSK